jgi:hypothetical protein
VDDALGSFDKDLRLARTHLRLALDRALALIEAGGDIAVHVVDLDRRGGRARTDGARRQLEIRAHVAWPRR